MSSQGTGTDISAQDANDLLQKLITESTKVQAMFVGRGSVTAAIQGFVSWQPGDIVQITERLSITSPSLAFGLKDVAAFKYGDNRAFPGASPLPGTPRLSSALCFVYPDGSQVALFEIAAPA